MISLKFLRHARPLNSRTVSRSWRLSGILIGIRKVGNRLKKGSMILLNPMMCSLIVTLVQDMMKSSKRVTPSMMPIKPSIAFFRRMGLRTSLSKNSSTRISLKRNKPIIWCWESARMRLRVRLRMPIESWRLKIIPRTTRITKRRTRSL